LHYFTELVAFAAYYVKVVEDTPYILQVKCSPKNLVFSGISFMTIFAANHPSEGVKVKSEFLICPSPSSTYKLKPDISKLFSTCHQRHMVCITYWQKSCSI